MKLRPGMCVGFVMSAVFFCACLAAESPAVQGAATASESKTVSVKGFTFIYKVENQNLVASVAFVTSGWVAVGFNPSLVMKGANIIMGYADGEKSVVSDQFGNGMFEHQPDTLIGGKNNIISGACTEANGMTTLSFTIPLNSGDSKDVVLEPGKKIKVIFAEGKDKNMQTKHTKKTSTKIVL